MIKNTENQGKKGGRGKREKKTRDTFAGAGRGNRQLGVGARVPNI